MPGGSVELLRRGEGAPVTLFAHGLGSGIAETRPLAAGVPGTRAFLGFPGHGAAPPMQRPWSYQALADVLAAAADQAGAEAAAGVSMGAGALLRLLTRSPHRFRRLALLLPALVDRPRPAAARQRLADMHAAARAGDRAALARLVAEEIPAEHRAGAGRYVDRRVAVLCRPAVRDALAALGEDLPVPDPAGLRAVTAPVLVVGQGEDLLHPLLAAERLAELLPNARLLRFRRPAVWTERARLRREIAGFFAGPGDAQTPGPARPAR